MEKQKRNLTIGLIVAAIIIFTLVLFCNRNVSNEIDKQATETIKDLTIE